MGATLERIASALVVFAYDRPGHLERCLTSLQANLDSAAIRTFIYIDGPKELEDSRNHDEVFEIAKKFKERNPNSEIIASPINLGLRTAIITATTDLFLTYEALIIVEDDLILAQDFLSFMLSCIKKFKNDKTISSISGFAESRFPPFVATDLIAARRQSCWGWATWRDRWNAITWDTPLHDDGLIKNDLINLNAIGWDLAKIYGDQISRKISSWAITFDAHAARLGLRSLQPRYTLVQNLGMDGSGTHFTAGSSLNKKFKTWDVNRNLRTDTYTISKTYDFWLKLKHSRVQNKFQKLLSFAKLRLQIDRNKH